MTTNNVEERVECRLCGNFTYVSNIRKQMKDKIKGFVSFKEFVEYFCRIELIENDEFDLPQGACNECYNTILKFCIFSVNVEKHQNAIINRLPKKTDNKVKEETEPPAVVKAPITKRKRTNSASKDSGNVSSSTNESEKGEVNGASPNRKNKRDKRSNVLDSSNDDVKTKENHNLSVENTSFRSDNSAGKMRSEYTVKSCFNDVYELFKHELNEYEKSYEKITIKEKLLLEGGEIPKEWLSRYRNFVTWQDLDHFCSHCNKTFKSLVALLMHFDKLQLPIHKRQIKCAECDAIFKESRYIVGYVNHVDKQHYSHLKFGCIFCDKIFYNIVKLCDHGIKCHGDLRFKYYICYDCGLFCHTMDTLKQHKSCHEI